MQTINLTPLRFYLLQVKYFNNQVIVELVEAQHVGVLAILDEACLNVGKVTDKVRESGEREWED